MRTKRSLLLLTAAVSFAGLAMAACESEPMASVAYVDMKDSGLKAQADQLNSQVASLNTQVAEVNRAAQQASAKADEAGRKAAGNFEHHVLFTDDSIQFDTNKSELSQDNQAKLTAFAEKIKSDNQNVYIEIQGHGDSRGSAKLNMALGEKRADAVRRYLMDQGIPLYHMSTISFGEERPKGDNATTQGQDVNRRAVLVVEN
jgi:outer membrane protein OmpA-like peptidoglycan-associated protein